MASVHVYVRVQASGSNAQTAAIEHAVQALRTAVEAAGGEWFGRGDVHVLPDAVLVAAKPPRVKRAKITKAHKLPAVAKPVKGKASRKRR